MVNYRKEANMDNLPNESISSTQKKRSISEQRSAVRDNLVQQEFDKKRVSKSLLSQIDMSEIEVIEYQEILTDEETPEQLYSKDRNFYVNHMIDIKPIDNNTFQVTNFTPTDFSKLTVLMQLPNSDSQVALGYLPELQGHSQLICHYPFIKKDSLYQTATGSLISLDSDVNLLDNPPVLDVYTDHPVFEKLQQITVNWDARFYYKGNQGGIHLPPAYARGYTVLIAEIAYIVSSNEYKNSFLQGRFGEWIDPQDTVNEDGSDKIRKFSTEMLEKLYHNGLNFKVYRLGLLGKESGIGGTGSSSKTGYARIALLESYFYWEDDAIFETFGHEYGHAICFPMNYIGHETNIPHVDFYKGNGLIFSELYNKFRDSNRLPFSLPGMKTNEMLGFTKVFATQDIKNAKRLMCALEQLDEEADTEEPAQTCKFEKPFRVTPNTSRLIQELVSTPDQGGISTATSLIPNLPDSVQFQSIANHNIL